VTTPNPLPITFEAHVKQLPNGQFLGELHISGHPDWLVQTGAHDTVPQAQQASINRLYRIMTKLID